MNRDNKEFLYITSIILGNKYVREILSAFTSGLYYTNIRQVEFNATVNQKFTDKSNFIIWHDRLGHPGTIMM